MSSLGRLYRGENDINFKKWWRRGLVLSSILVVISVLWIPVILSFKNPQLFTYIQAISSYLPPPITAVFLLATCTCHQFS